MKNKIKQFNKIIIILISILCLSSCGEETKNCNYPLTEFGYPYNFPDSINIFNNSYHRIEKSNPNYPSFDIVNNELVGFVIREDDIDKFELEYPDIEYFVFPDLFFYFGEHNRLPLYSIYGDDDLAYISNPEYFIYAK